MTGLLEKKAVERYLGRAEVRQVFSVPKIGAIAGCGVVDGKILRSAQVRLLRDSRVIFTGKISSLKRFKDDAKEVAQGYECGIGIENFNDVKIGDLIEAFTVDMVAQELDAPLSSKEAPAKVV
jgi:translation initiation factor IF-2